MSDPKQTEPRRGFPGSFLLFILSAILLITLIQNFMNIRVGDVAFSHQLEHLVNLELIQEEDSRKTALNDKLVTFSGKFRERLGEDSKVRYKYLTLLHSQHEMQQEKLRLEEEMDHLKGKIQEAAETFLVLSQTPLIDGAYVVVDSTYDSIDRENRVVIRELPEADMPGLVDLEQELKQLQRNPDEKEVREFGLALHQLIRSFRSPKLGVGSEILKQKLRSIDSEVAQANTADEPAGRLLDTYASAVVELRSVVRAINQREDEVALGVLRSVRNYKQRLGQYELLLNDLEETSAKLEKSREQVADVVWFFNNQELSTRSLEKQEAEAYHHWYLKAKAEWEKFDSNKGSLFRAPDQPLNLVLEKTFKSQEPAPNYVNYLITLAPVILILVLLYFFFSRQMKGVGSGAMNFGKSPARLFKQGETKVTFKDVAGADESLEELQEVVDFLKNPKKFTSLGGRIPKGVLCVGPPGTGKTLIARAVAGEAKRPFFSISGSDFVEMFVGVGASRIRDMFEQAKKNAPCIIFMDEIDAVGRHRGAGIGGGHDEREQTLNQLLVEMDGFDTQEGVILMAATNRPDVLDRALLRPGRFDRQVVLDLPDIKGRFDILKVHAKKIKMDDSVELMPIAKATPGASGADLENILNEAALAAARKGRSAVTQQECVEARDKVLFGKERRSMQIDEHEKETTAYHEAGHAIVGMKVKGSDPVDKVTIIPRGRSLGATHFLPEKNRLSYWKKELADRLAVLMGGRAAEDIFCDDGSSGAQQDIAQATQLARNMVCQWGMSDKLGLVAYEERSEEGRYLTGGAVRSKGYSEDTAREIDAEVKAICDKAYNDAATILEENREAVDLMAKMLVKFETLDKEDCLKILDGTWSDKEKEERLKAEAEAHMVAKPPPPPPKEDGVGEDTPRPDVEPPPTPTDVTA